MTQPGRARHDLRRSLAGAQARYAARDGSKAAAARMTYAEYCELERSAASKHEYLRGEVFALAGGTIEHGRLAARSCTC